MVFLAERASFPKNKKQKRHKVTKFKNKAPIIQIAYEVVWNWDELCPIYRSPIELLLQNIQDTQNVIALWVVHYFLKLRLYSERITGNGIENVMKSRHLCDHAEVINEAIGQEGQITWQWAQRQELWCSWRSGLSSLSFSSSVICAIAKNEGGVANSLDRGRLILVKSFHLLTRQAGCHHQPHRFTLFATCLQISRARCPSRVAANGTRS